MNISGWKVAGWMAFGIALILPAAKVAGQEAVPLWYDGFVDGQFAGGVIMIPAQESAPPVMSPPGPTRLDNTCNVVRLELHDGQVVDVPVGPNEKTANRLNFVYLGDGFAEADIGFWATTVDRMWGFVNSVEPFHAYTNYLNAYRIDTISNESGVDQPEFGIERDTALDGAILSPFFVILDPAKAAAAWACAPAMSVSVQVANAVPLNFCGGTAGQYSASVIVSSDYADETWETIYSQICVHEFGHAVGDLMDEYFTTCPTHTGGDLGLNLSDCDAPTMVSQHLKWYRWLDPACAGDCYSDAPECGDLQNMASFYHPCLNQWLYASRDRVCAYESNPGLYRSTLNSIMNSPYQAGATFGAVNAEQIIIGIYKKVSPIDDATPASPFVFPAHHQFFVTPMQPLDHALDVQWSIDGQPVSGATSTTFTPDSAALTAGTHVLSVRVTDNTPRIRDEAARQSYMTAARQWTIVADCNGNGVNDMQDIASGTSLDLDADLLPDECEPDCNMNSIPDDDDIQTGRSQDADCNGVPDECEVGVWRSMGSGVESGAVKALALYEGKLIAGGVFSSAGGVAVNSIATWDGDSWSPLGDGLTWPGNAPFVQALCIYNGELVVAGRFALADGASANNIARWNGNSWSALNGESSNGLNGNVSALTVYNGELIAAGSFTTAGGTPASRVARWNGTLWQPLGTGINNAVNALTVYNGELIAGGPFITAGGISASRIARWNGTAWQPLGTGMNSVVTALAVYDGALIAGGSFITSGGTSANRIASWNGQNWSSLGSGLDSTVIALTPIADGTYQGLYVGGQFLSAGGVPSPLVAKWGPDSQWHAMSLQGGAVPGSGTSPYYVYAILADADSALYAGGYFLTTGCEPANCITRWTHVVASGPSVLSAASVKQHGSQGEHASDLPLAGSNPGVECRNGGPTQLVFTFSADVQVAAGLPAVLMSAGTVEGVSITGSQMTVALSSVPDKSRLSIWLYGVRDLAGRALVGDSTVQIIARNGDVNGDGSLNLTDLAFVASCWSGPGVAPLGPACWRADLDEDGDVDQSDFGLLQAMITNVP